MSSRHGWAGAGDAAGAGPRVASAGCDVKVGESGGLSVDFAAGKATDEWVRTYDIKPGGRLDIINVNGQIEASPATGTQVEVRAIARGQGRERGGLPRVASKGGDARGGHARPSQHPGARGQRARPGISPAAGSPSSTTCAFRRSERAAQDPERRSPAREHPGPPHRGWRRPTAASAAAAFQVRWKRRPSTAESRWTCEAVTGETRMVTVNGGVMLDVGPGVNADLEATVVNGGVSVAGRHCRCRETSAAGSASRGASAAAGPVSSCRPPTAACASDRAARPARSRASPCSQLDEIGGQRRQVHEIPPAAPANVAARHDRPGSLLLGLLRRQRRLDRHPNERRVARRNGSSFPVVVYVVVIAPLLGTAASAVRVLSRASILERRYGLSTETTARWLADHLKAAAHRPRRA